MTSTLACVATMAAVAAAGTTTGNASPPTDASPKDERPSIVVKTKQASGPLSRHLTGVNNNLWFNNSQGLWDPATDAPNPDALAKIIRTGINLIRFPGGTSANLYDWKRAIGPTEQRDCQTDAQNSGIAQADSVYGPDEHMKLVGAAGAEAEIMVAFANEFPGDAADWVEYMNAPVGTNPRGGVVQPINRRAHVSHVVVLVHPARLQLRSLAFSLVIAGVSLGRWPSGRRDGQSRVMRGGS